MFTKLIICMKVRDIFQWKPENILVSSKINKKLNQTMASRHFSLAVQNFQYYFTFDPLGQPQVTAGRDHCFRTCCPSVRPHFSNLEKQKNRKQCSLLAWLWVWPSGSLMTPVLFIIITMKSYFKKFYYECWQEENKALNFLLKNIFLAGKNAFLFGRKQSIEFQKKEEKVLENLACILHFYTSEDIIVNEYLCRRFSAMISVK